MSWPVIVHFFNQGHYCAKSMYSSLKIILLEKSSNGNSWFIFNSYFYYLCTFGLVVELGADHVILRYYYFFTEFKLKHWAIDWKWIIGKNFYPTIHFQLTIHVTWFDSIDYRYVLSAWYLKWYLVLAVLPMYLPLADRVFMVE